MRRWLGAASTRSVEDAGGPLSECFGWDNVMAVVGGQFSLVTSGSGLFHSCGLASMGSKDAR